jgi:ribosomal protein L31E
VNIIELAYLYHDLKDEMTPSTKEFIYKLQKEYSKEIERLNNIIKEVKEYIEKHIVMSKNSDVLVDMNINELLEILNKVGVDKNG